MQSDVLVVGGGPAGLYAALRLAREGLRVRVLEEHDRIGDPVHCTGILGSEAFELPEVPREGILGWPNAARFHSPDGHRLGYEGPAGEVCIVDRGDFDRALARAAVDAGVVVTTGARAVGVQAERDGILVRVQVAGQARLASARVCLLACGARYRFQQALGWGTPPLLFSSAQTELAAPAGSELEVFLLEEVAPAGFAWLVPVRRGDGGRAKVGVITARRPTRALARLVEDLRRTGRVSRFRGPVVVRPAPLSPLRRTHGDRIIAIGDAAGLVKPTTGGGIYYGLLSARWAAETVKRAFDRGDFSAATLSAYEETWRAHLGPELTIGVWFRRLVARLAPSDLDALTQLALTDGVMPIVRTTARFNWHRELLLQLLRHPGVLGLLLRRLVAAPGAFEVSGAPRSILRTVGT